VKFAVSLSVLGLLLGVVPAPAQDSAEPTATPKPAAAAAKLATPKPTAPKLAATTNDIDALAAVPLAERAAIRAALLWSAREDATVTLVEDPVLAAIKSYQKRNKAPVTGVLTPAERDGLLAAAKTHDDEFGWNVVADPATGVRIGLPTKMVPIARDAANGTRWSSRHGDVQVETFRIKTAESLSALFDQQKREPSNRRTEYSVMKADNFFISGLQGLKKFSVRAQLRNGELRGFTMLFDQAMEGIVAPVMVAMSSAFTPFPETSAPFATLAKAVEYGTGLVVSADGYLIADRKVTDNCQVIVASGIGNAERVDADAATGLALLRVYGKGNLNPVQLASETPKSTDLTLVGIPDPNTQDGERKLTEVKAKLLDGAAIELRQPVPVAGFSGAAALDAQGRVLGIMQTRNAVVASAEPVAPPVQLIAAGTIRDFLAAHSIAAAPSNGDPKASIVRVICVRK
jgi:hypothetical protein